MHQAGPQEIAEIFNVRAALEGMAAHNIVQSPQRQATVLALRAFLPPQDLGGDFTVHADLDLRFHRRLCEASGNSVLLEQWCSLEDRMRIVFFSSGARHPVPIMARHHHEPILVSIEEGDANAAQEIVRHHMCAAAAIWAPGVRLFC